MGDVVKFRKRPRNRGQFRGQGDWKPEPKGSKRLRLSSRLKPFAKAALPIVVLLALAFLWWGIDAVISSTSGGGCTAPARQWVT